MVMRPDSTQVTRRPYDRTRRRERAVQSREAILDAASRRFLGEGFRATTISSIAVDAAVSVDTIYKAFGGKSGLVKALCERALAGSGTVPAETRSDELQAETQDPRRLLHELGRLTTEVAPRIAPLLLLLATAAETDQEAARLRAELDSSRLARMTRVATVLAGKVPLRADLSIHEAGQVMWTYSSPELYQLLVITCGWSPDRFGKFVGEALAAALLPDADPAPPS
jgi:AcrR family transcriptional regulator